MPLIGVCVQRWGMTWPQEALEGDEIWGLELLSGSLLLCLQAAWHSAVSGGCLSRNVPLMIQDTWEH